MNANNENNERSETTISLTFPTSWQTLTVRQLRYVFYLLAAGYTATELKTYCLFRWSGLQVLAPQANGYLVRYQKQSYFLTAHQVAAILPSLNYLDALPTVPIRYDVLHHHRAAAPDLADFPFGSYLICDNLYQGYLHTQSLSLLSDLAAVLYHAPNIRLSDADALSVFYWFAAVKSHFAQLYPHFYSPSSTTSTDNLQQRLTDAMNAQIRALTHGDITRESTILQLDTHRALTELDALAHDYQQLQSAHK